MKANGTLLYTQHAFGGDPALGRMNQVDPMATRYASVSPYNYSFNDQVSLNDPSGADPYENWSDYTGPGSTNDGSSSMWANRYVWSGYINGNYTGWDVSLNLGGAFVNGRAGMKSLTNLGESIDDWRTETFSGIRTIGESLGALRNSTHGGSWSNGNIHFFGSDKEAFEAGVSYNDKHHSWGDDGGTQYGSAFDARKAYQKFAPFSIPISEMIAHLGPGDPGYQYTLPNGEKVFKDVNGRTYYVGETGVPHSLGGDMFDYLPGGSKFWGTDMGSDIQDFMPILDSEKKRGQVGDAIDDLIDMGKIFFDHYFKTPGPTIPNWLIPQDPTPNYREKRGG